AEHAPSSATPLPNRTRAAKAAAQYMQALPELPGQPRQGLTCAQAGIYPLPESSGIRDSITLHPAYIG
ncbi:MAG TPA: hypothetical protein VLM83_00220, partial [Anaerolineales bacterium]|nr:hypothetical protein [Anaerolineales bacterium]